FKHSVQAGAVSDPEVVSAVFEKHVGAIASQSVESGKPFAFALGIFQDPLHRAGPQNSGVIPVNGLYIDTLEDYQFECVALESIKSLCAGPKISSAIQTQSSDIEF